MMMRTSLLCVAALASVVMASPGRSQAEPTQFFLVNGYALSGHDPVAYVRRGASVPGNPAFALKWRGAIWLFESEDSMVEFEMNPTAYAPQYGGYCAYSIAVGDPASGDPDVFSIVGGKLYLNHDLQTREIWSQDRARHISEADRNWPSVLKK
jgi:hypothetical protein